MELLTTYGATVKLKCGGAAGYMVADGDNHAVCRRLDGESLSAKWLVETVPGTTNIIRLKSYTFDGAQRFLQTAAAGSLVQSTAIAPGSMLAWKPSADGVGVRLESEKPGFFLKANCIGEPLSIVQYRPADTATAATRWFPVPVSSPSQDPGRV